MSMTESIQHPFRRGVAVLIAISAEQFTELEVVYAQPCDRLGALVQRSAHAIEQSDESARELAVLLLSLRQAYPALSDLTTAAARLIEPDDPDFDLVSSRARALLASKAVTLLARASRLQLDNPRNYSECAFSTATRPLLPNSAEDAWIDAGATDDSDPYGAVIVSQLRIDHFEDGKPGSYFVSLDLDDLEAMQKAIERAIKKHRSLAEYLRRSNQLLMNPLGGE